MKRLALIALLLAAAPAPKPAPSPGEIVAAAPASDWITIPPSDLLVMDLVPDAKGKMRRVVIQLMSPPFSQGWVGNIRKLAEAHWYDGTSINRVQDNYVVQWGDASADDDAAVRDKAFMGTVEERTKAYRNAHPRARKAEIDEAIRGFRQAVMNEQIVRLTAVEPPKAKALPLGLVTVGESEYLSEFTPGLFTYFLEESGRSAVADLDRNLPGTLDAPPQSFSDPYSANVAFARGFPVGLNFRVQSKGSIWHTAPDEIWPVHCYGMVGVGRNLSPDTGSGAELYTVIGHAPRHLDRNIALVGRVIEGIEHLSSLPRGSEALGFYKTPEERVPIVSVRMGPEMRDLAAYQYLSTQSETFARYADARANRRDPFFIRPAGGADICNIPVPVRRLPEK